MGASNRWSNCQRSNARAPGGTRTHVAALRVRSPRRWTTSAFHSVGSEGLEPSPTWLRARHAAANTLIPCSCFASCCFSARNRRGGNRTLDLVLIRDLLSPLSYAPAVGPEGFEPSPARLKVCCAAVTPRPQVWSGRMRLSSRGLRHVLSLLCSVVRGGVEPPPATYQIAMLPLQHRTVGKAGVEPTVSCSQGTRGAVPLLPVCFPFNPVARMGIEPISPP